MSLLPSPPGDTILELLDEQNKTVQDLAYYLGYSLSYTTYLIAGVYPITPEMCEKLSEYLGSTKEFWMNRELNYSREVFVD